MGVGTGIDGGGEAQARGSLIGGFVAQQGVARHVGTVARGLLRVQEYSGLEKTPLTEVLSPRFNREQKQQQRLHCSLRSAATVNSLSFTGIFNCSLSSLRMVRPPRRRSFISSVRASQTPCTFSTSR